MIRRIRAIVLMAVVFVAGCYPDNRPAKRFQRVELIGSMSALYLDTQTGQYWIYQYGGWGTGTWTPMSDDKEE